MEKLGLYQYNVLDLDSKAKLLWEHGIFIMNRFEGDSSINLYSLYDFFVEVWYQREPNTIDRIRTFKSLDALEPYLDRIDLNLKP